MRIILTGHKGFIGQHYEKFLRDSSDHLVQSLDLLDGDDLKDRNVVENIKSCEAIVHLAATNGTRLFYETPTEVAFNNTLPTFNLIDRFLNTNTKFVFASTCEIFNGAVDAGICGVPTDENVPIMFADITNPRWSYSVPKALGENLVSNSGLPWLVIRFFNIYGPGQKDHFISEFVERCKLGEYYINGNDTRSFCYIDDALTMMHELVRNFEGGIVNIGRCEETPIKSVAEQIMEIMKIDPKKLKILDGPHGSVSRRCPNTELVERLTGFTKFTPLNEGLKKTVESLL